MVMARCYYREADAHDDAHADADGDGDADADADEAAVPEKGTSRNPKTAASHVIRAQSCRLRAPRDCRWMPPCVCASLSSMALPILAVAPLCSR